MKRLVEIRSDGSPGGSSIRIDGVEMGAVVEKIELEMDCRNSKRFAMVRLTIVPDAVAVHGDLPVEVHHRRLELETLNHGRNHEPKEGRTHNEIK